MTSRALAALALPVLALAACSGPAAPTTTSATTGGAATSTTSKAASTSGTTTASGASTSGSAAGQGGASCTYTPSGSPAKAATPPATSGVASTGAVTWTMKTSAGDITIAMDRAKAPCTVNSFSSLASQKYFDDTACHRLTTQGIFVLQCGDPKGTGTGGPGYKFADELKGTETYPAGTVAMANAGPGTNGSQFFLVYADTQLPAKYTVFGQMDAKSIEVVKKVAAAGAAGGKGDGKPNTEVKISSVTQG